MRTIFIALIMTCANFSFASEPENPVQGGQEYTNLLRSEEVTGAFAESANFSSGTCYSDSACSSVLMRNVSPGQCSRGGGRSWSSNSGGHCQKL